MNQDYVEFRFQFVANFVHSHLIRSKGRDVRYRRKGWHVFLPLTFFSSAEKKKRGLRCFGNCFGNQCDYTATTDTSKRNSLQLFGSLWFWKWQIPRGMSCQAEPILSVNSLCHKESCHVPLCLWVKSTSYSTISVIHVGHRVTKTKQVEMYLLHSSRSCYCFNLNICPVGIRAGRRLLWNTYVNVDTEVK